MVWAVVGIGVSVTGIGLSVAQQEKAKSAARRASKKEAAIEAEVTAEKIVQIDRQELLMRQATVAGTAASGVRVDRSMSPLEVLADQAEQFRRERAITESVGASRASTALDRGAALATQYKYQGASAALSGLSDVFSIAANTDWDAVGKKFGIGA